MRILPGTDLPPINVPPVKLNLQPQKPLEPVVCIPKSYEAAQYLLYSLRLRPVSTLASNSVSKISPFSNSCLSFPINDST